MKRPVRIGNFSGVIGDRVEALEETIKGQPGVDVAIGDYMAEITMSMIAASYRENPEGARKYYARSFLKQIRPLLGDIAERGTKVIVNAGIFDPVGAAGALRLLVKQSGLVLSVASVHGDDLLPRLDELAAVGQLVHLDSRAPFREDTTTCVAANAYLGGWGIAAALNGGADIVITGRTTDASLVLGAAAWWHGWRTDAFDELAGAIAAAHIIECGTQATGGNFSGFSSIPSNTVLGFPVAEIAADGSSVITKRPADGGAVTVDTVTAQLMYEIQGPRYLNPDVVLHVDAVRLSQEGPDRVRVSGAQGGPPPLTTKVGIHFFDGYRAATWAFPTGLQMDEKLALLRAQAEIAADGLDLDELLFTPLGMPAPDPKNQYEATVAVRIAVAGPTAAGVRSFCGRFRSYGLGSIPGFYVDFLQGIAGPEAVARVRYWPGLVRQSELRHEVDFGDGRVELISVPPSETFSGQPHYAERAEVLELEPTVDVPLGSVVFARSGDKGGNANLGVWTPSPVAFPWLQSYLTVERLATLLGLGPDVVVERYEMPGIKGISFVLRDYFDDGGSSYLGLDQVGKGLGEFLRSRHAPVPLRLLPADAPAMWTSSEHVSLPGEELFSPS